MRSFASPELAQGDLQKLQDAGLDAYLGGTYFRYHGGVQLRVPESQVARAQALLGIDASADVAGLNQPRSPDQFVCPECGSADSYPVPPYAFRVLVTSFAVSVAGFISGAKGIAMSAFILGWCAAIWLGRHSGKYRCRACGREWKP